MKADRKKELVGFANSLQDEMGFRHFSYVRLRGAGGSLTDGIVVVTYPVRWVMEYAARSYEQIDPVINQCGQRLTPLDWRLAAKTSLDYQRFFRAAERSGIGRQGISFPTRASANAAAMLSLTFDLADMAWEERKRRDMSRWQEAAAQLEKVILRALALDVEAPSQTLTKRERECICWAAAGKTDQEIADILGIRRWTVVAHLQSVKYKLGCLNRTAAAVKAVALGIVEFHDHGPAIDEDDTRT